MIYFIRHAESLANKIDLDLKQKFGLDKFKES